MDETREEWARRVNAPTKTIVAKRQSGKTTEVIRRCAELGGYIVCVDRRRAEYIRNLAAYLDLSIPFPIALPEFLARAYHPLNCGPLHFDDADDLLRAIAAGTPVATISVTESE